MTWKHLQAEVIHTKKQQKDISEDIKNVTKNAAEVMNADNVEKTSNIINNVLKYNENESLPEDVSMNYFHCSFIVC